MHPDTDLQAAQLLWQHWQVGSTLDNLPENLRPASGPPTLMWLWPAALVAAIFQPLTLRPEACGKAA